MPDSLISNHTAYVASLRGCPSCPDRLSVLAGMRNNCVNRAPPIVGHSALIELLVPSCYFEDSNARNWPSRQSCSIGLATKRILDGQRPKLLAVLKIFTE